MPQERIAIEQDAAQARIDAYKDYEDQVADISTELVDTVRGIQDEITTVIEDAAEERVQIQEYALSERRDLEQQYQDDITQIESQRDADIQAQQDRLTDIQENALAARLDAEEDYADRMQDIQNNLVDRVVDIQRDLTNRLADLRQQELDTEQDRLDSLVELHEDTKDRLQALEQDRLRTQEDIRTKYSRDVEDARVRLQRDLKDAGGDEEKETAAQQRFDRRVQDLNRENHRDYLDLARKQEREREDLLRRQAEQEIAIAEQVSARLAEIEQQKTEAQAAARTGITEAESQAGVTFGEAQANYVSALSESEQAAAAHATALQAIAENTESALSEVNTKIVEITDAAFSETAAAASELKDALAALTLATDAELDALQSRTGATLGGLQGQITDAEGRAGLTFGEALQHYTPAVDLNTQALNTLNATLANINATETTGLTRLTAAGVADRAETTAAQQALLAEAGVSLDAARAGYVPALSAAAQATLTLNETIRDLDTGLQEALTAINVEGQLDRQTTAENIQTAIANALAQQLELEGQAGLTFAEASLAFQPGVSDLRQAGLDRGAALSGIDTAEQEGIAEVNAQSIADRLATDAEITAARDAYIQARDQAIFEHNTAIRELGVKEAADIATIKETLKVDLAGIQTTLTAELEEIREQKILFDTKMNELITAINETANLDFAALKTDTEAMRLELEAIAEEARNNAWKSAIFKVANVGITVAGVAVGAAVGGPAGAAVGGQIGGAIGGLVEQGGNELFHFEQTDAIARRLARTAAYRQPRPAPDYLPTPTQLRNAQDVGREVVAGVMEGFAQKDAATQVTPATGFDGTQEIQATLYIEYTDGVLIELRDQLLRIEQQDR